MADFSKLVPFGNNVLFQFIDETSGDRGEFTERTRSGILMTRVLDAQKTHRWGKVVAIGPLVSGVEIHDYILVEALMWTTHERFEDQKIWKTHDSKIMCATTEAAETLSY